MQRGPSSSTLAKLTHLVARGVRALFSQGQADNSSSKSDEGDSQHPEVLPPEVVASLLRRKANTPNKRSVTVADLRPASSVNRSPSLDKAGSEESAAEIMPSASNTEQMAPRNSASDTPATICPNCTSDENLVWFYTVAIDISAIVTMIPAYLLLFVASYWLALSWAEGLSFALLFTVPLLINFSKRALCERCGAQIDPRARGKGDNAE